MWPATGPHPTDPIGGSVTDIDTDIEPDADVPSRRSRSGKDLAESGDSGRGGRGDRTRNRGDDGRSFWLLSFFRWLARFVREIVAEMRKVIWPSRQELITYTVVVVIFVSVVVAIVAGLDVGFAKLVVWIFG
jgi:preprotein translocase subunit SecE